MPTKPFVFTSWKEIASYLGKSVRTVQRWEAQFGLPVQRLADGPCGRVRAAKEDLDQWASAHWKLQDQVRRTSELESLRRQVASLLTENASLKQQLQEERDRARASVPDLPMSGKLEIERLLQQNKLLKSRLSVLQQQFAETLDLSRNLKKVWEWRKGNQPATNAKKVE